MSKYVHDRMVGGGQSWQLPEAPPPPSPERHVEHGFELISAALKDLREGVQLLADSEVLNGHEVIELNDKTTSMASQVAFISRSWQWYGKDRRLPLPGNNMKESPHD